MNEAWGRFTARGGEAVEEKIHTIITETAQALAGALRHDEYHAVVLIGGYGRGEGGVEVVDGEEHPHNNLDFLLITKDLQEMEETRLKARLDPCLAPLVRKYGIGMDLSPVSGAKLRRSPCLVMWYDMRFGHKTILGDESFVPALTRFRVNRITPADVRNLLVNRGTLFIINDLLLERGRLTEADRKLIVKHTIKGIIGYGDALLFCLGQYDWSDEEKQRRMRTLTEVPEPFRRLYDDAMEFRFRTRYEEYLTRHPGTWMEQLRVQLAPVHLQCEAHRLKRPNLDWQHYAETAFAAVLREEPFSMRAWAKKFINWKKDRNCILDAAWAPRMGYICSGPRGRMPILFPVIAYQLRDDNFRDLARTTLDAKNCDFSELRRAYLKQWCIHGDINFPAVLQRMDISLDAED